MASSAVYRYFPSRDALLTALIVDAFDGLGDVAEKAAGDSSEDTATRWCSLTSAIRRWALDHRHDYALVYGSPVPGYRAPDDTAMPAARVVLAMIGIVADGVQSGEIDTTATGRVPRPVHQDLARIRDAAGPDLPDEVMSRILTVWTGLFGAISYELFGHLHPLVEHGDALFDHQTRRAAAYLIHGPKLDA